MTNVFDLMARKKKPRNPPTGVLPPAERYQHDEIERVRGKLKPGERAPLYVLTQTALDRYLRTKHPKTRRPYISQEQHDAAMILFREWRASGCAPTIVASYSVRIARPIDLTEHQADMRQRVTRALRAVGEQQGPGDDIASVTARILVHVVFLDRYVGEWERQANRPRGWGMIVLRAALDRLIDHYDKRRRGLLPPKSGIDSRN